MDKDRYIEILELLDHFKGKAYFVDGTTASGMGIIDYLFSPSTMPYSKTFLTLQIFYLLYVIIDTHIGNDYFLPIM
jgi:hypothetical protein